jgi:hypothetical protein
VSVRIDRAHIKGSPFAVEVTPSEVSAAHSVICDGEHHEQTAPSTGATEAATLIAVQGMPVPMNLMLRDRYGNPLSPQGGVADPDAVTVVLTARSANSPDHAPAFEYEATAMSFSHSLGIKLQLTVYEAGCFTADVQYKGATMGDATSIGEEKKPPLALLVVSELEATHVQSLAEQSIGSLDRVCTFEAQAMRDLRAGSVAVELSDEKLAILPPTFNEVVAMLEPETEPKPQSELQPELEPEPEPEPNEDTASTVTRMMMLMYNGMKEMVGDAEGDGGDKWIDVQVVLTPLRIVVREYKMKVIPWRTIASWVSRPSLRIHLDPNDTQRVIIDDDDAAPCVLRFQCDTSASGASANRMTRNVFFGLYSRFLRERMAGVGGTNSFEAKRMQLFTNLRKTIGSAAHDRQPLMVSRRIFRESSMAQLHRWSKKQWYGKSHVTFHAEEGVDCGGVSNEFWDMLGRNLFTPVAEHDGDGEGSGEEEGISGMVDVEMPGEKAFVRLRMDLSCAGRLTFSAPSWTTTGDAIREIVGVADLHAKRMVLRRPKQARKDRPYCIRIELDQPDSCGRNK